VDPATASAVFLQSCCAGPDGRRRSTFHEGEALTVQVRFEVRSPIKMFEISTSVNTTLDVRVFSVLSDVIEGELRPGVYQVDLPISPNYLRPGDYYMGLNLYTPALQDGVPQAAQFRIEPSPEAEGNVQWSYQNHGVVRLPYRWTRPVPAEAVHGRG
jgi:hypothetical protein